MTADREGPHSPISILASLRRDGRPAPRVVLRSLDSRASDGNGNDGPDRYEIQEEIGRGGVGIVYRGRDVDMGRDVALKVLHDDHLDRAELVTRFVEEAQIGGQLQHPGIVPIYELGLREDQRPFFTMKLVKGDTLREILDGRDSPEEDVPRLISVFEKVCQTMAYAHSRGVIHRDLKPANIMVGAFGEVQVVDWGFARVLAQGGIADERKARLAREEKTIIETARSLEGESGSEEGRVQGTLAYMPPEQALGRIDELDERSDVFSLGALLTEILTGSPPYTGESGSLVSEVIESKLDGAYRRLDESRADPDLVAIAKACLNAVRRERLRDAGQIAERVGAHITSTEERAHRSALATAESRAQTARDRREAAEQQSAAEKAERDAEQARQKADRQARARRQTRILAGVAVLALLVGSGAFLKFRRDRMERAAEMRHLLNEAVAAAVLHDRRGQWALGEAAASKAGDLARSGGFPAEKRAEVEALLAGIRERRSAAEAASKRHDREEALLAELRRIRSGLIDDDNATHCHGEYEAAFREFGVDVAALPVAAIVRNLGRTEDPKTIAMHLDIWSLENQMASPTLRLPWRKMGEIARTIDPDGWRNRLREALALRDAEELGELSEGTSVETMEPATAHLLATGLRSVGRRDAALALLRDACRRHPGDLWLNLSLAQGLMQLADPEWREALRYLSAALALKPESARIRAYMGWAMANRGEADRAVEMIRDAIARNPEDHLLHGYLGNVLARFAGDLDGALEEFRHAARLGPKRAVYQVRIGQTLGKRSDWVHSIQHYRAAIRMGGEHAPALSDLALLLAKRASPEFRDSEEALELALRGVTIATIRAQRRAPGGTESSRLRSAVQALEQVVATREKEDRADAMACFAIAAGRAVLGEVGGAKSALEKGLAWSEDHAVDREYERLRRVAERAISEAASDGGK